MCISRQQPPSLGEHTRFAVPARGRSVVARVANHTQAQSTSNGAAVHESDPGPCVSLVMPCRNVGIGTPALLSGQTRQSAKFPEL